MSADRDRMNADHTPEAERAAEAYKALMAATNKYNQFAAIAQQAGDEMMAAQQAAGEALEAWLVERGDLDPAWQTSTVKPSPPD